MCQGWNQAAISDLSETRSIICNVTQYGCASSVYNNDEDDGLRAIILFGPPAQKRNADTLAPEQEAIIKGWAERAESFRWMHHRAAVSYRATGAYMIYSSITFSFVAGLLQFGNHKQRRAWLDQLHCGFFSIASAALTSFEQFERPMDSAGEHEQAADNFAAFFRGASLELSLNPEDRRAFLDYMQLARVDYEKLVTTSPTLPDKVIDEYRERFKDRRNQPEVVAADIGLDINLKSYQERDDHANFTPDEYNMLKRYYNQKFGHVPKALQALDQPSSVEAVTDQQIADLENQIKEMSQSTNST